MKKRIIFLSAGALISMALFALIPTQGAQWLTLLALPFTLIGGGLRALSLSGGAGNIAAMALYVSVSLSPLLLMIRRRLNKEDLLLPLTAAAMLYVLYYMINPGLRPVWFSDDIGSLIYSGSVYSLILAWGVIRVLRRCSNMDTDGIYKTLRIFLIICASFCVLSGFGVGLGELRCDIAELQESNTMPGLNLMPTYVFRFLAFAATALEYGLDALVMLTGVSLLDALENDPYSGECCRMAQITASRCRRTIVIIILVSTAFNCAQMLFAPVLHNIDITFRLPLFSMAIAFGMLALTRLLGQGRELKEDNELFV